MKRNLAVISLLLFALTTSLSLTAAPGSAPVPLPREKSETPALSKKAERFQKRFDRFQKKLQKKLERHQKHGKSSNEVSLGFAGLFVLLLGGLFILLGALIPIVGILFIFIGGVVALAGLFLMMLLGGISVDMSEMN